jgi:hypothetical protein
MPEKGRAPEEAANGSVPWEEREVERAAREGAQIGGRAGDEGLDSAERPLVEAGEGVAEGFELAEEDLVEAAQHGDSRANPLADSITPETDGGVPVGEYGEADHEDSSEVRNDDR